MTTTIKVTSHNYPVLVRALDQDIAPDGTVRPDKLAWEKVFAPDDGEQVHYCTTTRRLEIVDLEYGDPRAREAKEPSAA